MKMLKNKIDGKLLFKAVILLALFLFSGNRTVAQSNCERLVWQDEFNGPSLDLTKWEYETGDGCPDLCQWGTGQLDYSTDRTENVRIENGRLILELRKENFGGREYTSGRIRTHNKKNFRYGRIEARVKGVYSQGAGFAFWMLGSDFETTSWPKCGEIDIFEQTGKWPDYNIGTAHFEEAWGHAWNQGKFYLPQGQRFADDFHVVGLEWTPDSMRWYIDGVYYHTFHISKPINGYDPFNRDFFLILSVGMGGDYSGPPDATTVTPQKVEVDYVRVYEGAYSTSIDGPKSVYEGDLYKEFSTKAVTGATYNWSVPSGSTIYSGQGTNTILVNFGPNSGKVQLNLTTPDCGPQTYFKDVEVQKAIIVNKVFDDFETNRNCIYDYRSGTFTENVNNPAPNYINSSAKVGRYVRNVVESWDAMVLLNVDPGHAGEFVQGKKRLFLDVYTDAPVGTKVSLGFENTAATVDQPYGKHSNYAAYTTRQNAWERLEFVLTDIPDKYAGSYKVNKFVLMFDPGRKSGNTWHFDNLRSGQSGPDAIILSQNILEDWDGTSNLPLSSTTGNYQPNFSNPAPGGKNTSERVLRYARSAATEYDNISYKIQLDDASPFRDGTNIIAFDVYTSAAPGKVVSAHLQDTTISGDADWQAPIHSIYEGRIEQQNQWQTVQLKWSSTPNASVPNVNVNKLVLLIDEKTFNGDMYYIDNIRILSSKQPESFVLSKVIEDFDANRNLNLVWTGEELTAPTTNPSPTGINTSANVAKYVRHQVNANDWLVYDVNTSLDAKALREKTKVFAMDVYTNAPAGKVITIGLEAGSLANSDNWPTGRHSDYSTATKVQDQWHTVKFIYSSSSDPSTPDNLVNKLTFTFNQGQPGDYTYYFDNLRILESIKDTVLNSIVVSPALSQNVALNQTIQFAATGKDQFGNNFPSNPVWSVNGGGTISASGLFRATSNGVYKVTATDGTVAGTADILIGESIRLSKITVTPAEATIYQGNPVSLAYSGFDQLNRPITVNNPTFSVSPSGGSLSNNVFTSNVPGVYTITVTSGNISASSVITVRATPVLTTLDINPKATKIYLNGTQQFLATALDQYGNTIAANLSWSAAGANISSSGLFSANAIGTYVIKVLSGDKQASTYISVLETPQNVALNKPATASSEENYGTTINYVNDGNATTRWSSVASDNQWVKIDLQSSYRLSRVVLNWETACGKSYNIRVSSDDATYTTIVSETNGSAGIKSYNIDATARYIMVQGLTRGTPYGYSLFEIEAYGVIATSPVLKSIVVNPVYTEINHNTSQNYSFNAFDQYGNNFATSVTWSVNGGNINSSGIYSATTVGTFNITASSGSISGTAQIKVKGNAPPVVTITTPANNSIFQRGSNVSVSVNATDSDGSVARVELFANGNLLATLTSAPYNYTWQANTAATYSLMARATDNLGAQATSTAVSVKINNPPTVTITAPVANSSVDEGTTLNLSALASDNDGNISRVEFFIDGTSKGTVSSAPYNLAVTGLAAGNHSVYALATDNNNGTTTSAAVSFTVNPVNIETNIALNKPASASSAEGAYVATLANDGNAGTRWGSAFADPQWIAVDLQGPFSISKVVLRWETASGKAYNIETSSDNSTWVPAKTVTAGTGGTETHLLSGITARYIRMYGTQRNTGWGYSLWEFEVYGTPSGNVPVTGVSLTSALLNLLVNETYQLSASIAPANASNKAVSWASSNASVATVSSTGMVTAMADGTAIITVTTADGNKTANCTVNVNTVGTNIALNKPVTATSTQSGLPVTNVNDGLANTRWGSEWTDAQTITIDLLAAYSVSKVVLNWETACGRNYTVEVSNDNVNWTTIYSTTTGNGGIITITPASSATGRYVRMRGTLRATGWGYSLWEFEVYGSTVKAADGLENYNEITSNSEPVIYPNPAVELFTLEVNETDRFSEIVVYDLTGKLYLFERLEQDLTQYSFNIEHLKAGTYIVKLTGNSGAKTLRLIKY
ncbi:MAG: discoidin domain-containing protein [Bacteroidales bacterium]|nr:discoidin domain-containing protein [Bacteroidales bacterium]